MTTEYYKVGGALSAETPSYVERQADEDIYKWILAGEYCYVFNSRQMGKSSLQARTVSRLEDKHFACIIADISGKSKDADERQWYNTLIKEFSEKVSNFLEQFDVGHWLKERDSLSPPDLLYEFIEKILLAKIPQEYKIVIFIDEIDNILEYNFRDAFFSLIRKFYNQRTVSPEKYNRLTFVLLGVTLPQDLIQDGKALAFNIGRSVNLQGFQPEESQLSALAKGLEDKVEDSIKVVKAILDWTGGQPFLTQKICSLVFDKPTLITTGEEEQSIKKLVESSIIDKWLSHDEAQHLKTIQTRVLYEDERKGRRLGLYKQILLEKEKSINFDGSYEQMELRLSGLVVEEDGKLKVYNRIYEKIFDLKWVKTELSKFRPPFYDKAINNWLDNGKKEKSPYLLSGEELKQAEEWKSNKTLADEDYEFISFSQKRDAEKTKSKDRQKKIFNVSIIVAVVAIGASILLGTVNFINNNNLQAQRKESEQTRQEIKKNLEESNQEIQKKLNQTIQDMQVQQQKFDQTRQDLQYQQQKFDLARQDMQDQQQKLEETVEKLHELEKTQSKAAMESPTLLQWLLKYILVLPNILGVVAGVLTLIILGSIEQVPLPVAAGVGVVVGVGIWWVIQLVT